MSGIVIVGLVGSGKAPAEALAALLILPILWSIGGALTAAEGCEVLVDAEGIAVRYKTGTEAVKWDSVIRALGKDSEGYPSIQILAPTSGLCISTASVREDDLLWRLIVGLLMCDSRERRQELLRHPDGWKELPHREHWSIGDRNLRRDILE